MTTEKELSIASLLKSELKKARVQKSNSYRRVSTKRDDIDMNKLLSADNSSDLKEFLDTLEC